MAMPDWRIETIGFILHGLAQAASLQRHRFFSGSD
jgi:hypothetical protein